jgi:hypothetical protein
MWVILIGLLIISRPPVSVLFPVPFGARSSLERNLARVRNRSGIISFRLLASVGREYRGPIEGEVSRMIRVRESCLPGPIGESLMILHCLVRQDSSS